MSLSFLGKRKWGLGMLLPLKTFFTGRLIATDMVYAAVASLTVIAEGDAVYLTGGAILPASSQADGGTLASNQGTFHGLFLGFAMARSASGSTTPVPVATAGLVLMDCAAASPEIGDLIGMSENSGGTALLNTTALGVAASNLSIGRCAERGTSITQMWVRFTSTIMLGGVQDKM